MWRLIHANKTQSTWHFPYRACAFCLLPIFQWVNFVSHNFTEVNTSKGQKHVLSFDPTSSSKTGFMPIWPLKHKIPSTPIPLLLFLPGIWENLLTDFLLGIAFPQYWPHNPALLASFIHGDFPFFVATSGMLLQCVYCIFLSFSGIFIWKILRLPNPSTAKVLSQIFYVQSSSFSFGNQLYYVIASRFDSTYSFAKYVFNYLIKMFLDTKGSCKLCHDKSMDY